MSLEKILARQLRSVRHIHPSMQRLTYRISYPASPLPLTKQEKLLLQVAHHADADDMKLLNAEQQAVQLAKINDKFDDFYRKPLVDSEEK